MKATSKETKLRKKLHRNPSISFQWRVICKKARRFRCSANLQSFMRLFDFVPIEHTVGVYLNEINEKVVHFAILRTNLSSLRSKRHWIQQHSLLVDHRDWMKQTDGWIESRRCSKSDDNPDLYGVAVFALPIPCLRLRSQQLHCAFARHILNKSVKWIMPNERTSRRIYGVGSNKKHCI